MYQSINHNRVIYIDILFASVNIKYLILYVGNISMLHMEQHEIKAEYFNNYIYYSIHSNHISIHRKHGQRICATQFVNN